MGEGLVAIVLLLAGGLKALQTGALVAGLPFSVIMFMMMYGIVKSFSADPAVLLQEEEEEEMEAQSLSADPRQV